VDRCRREFEVTKNGESFEVTALGRDRKFSWCQFPLVTLHKLLEKRGAGTIFVSEIPPTPRRPNGRPNGVLLEGEWSPIGNWRRLDVIEKERIREAQKCGRVCLWVTPANGKKHTPMRVYIKKVNGNVL